LRREAVPVVANNSKVTSHRTSFSGVISLGNPAQDFRVVFDTGSGHVVIPLSLCKDESCVKHRQYNMSNSMTAMPIQTDGSKCTKGELCDQMTIHYGTGVVMGEFVNDRMCFGKGNFCIQVTAVAALKMSDHPFKDFSFDGVLGLGLKPLTIRPEFNFLNRLVGGEFGVFLSQSQENSEIAIGGYNRQRVLGPVLWAPVAKAWLGYWQVRIKAVKIAGRTLDICKDGSCHGVVDTGSSHLGVPRSSFAEFMNMLSVGSGGAASCTEIAAAQVEIVLEYFNLMIGPRQYMRPLPLHKDVNLTELSGPSITSVGSNDTDTPALPVAAGLAASASNASVSSSTCTPRLMPVNFPEPLGPKFFVLGEPVLHRYYTVFNWERQRIGFAVSDTAHNRRELQVSQSVEQGLVEDQTFLVQVFVSVQRCAA